jgi:hypothetical protein
VPPHRKTRTGSGRIQGNLSGTAGGNPEPSRRYTAGRCRDYLRASVPLITGSSVPHPTSSFRAAGEEIVRAGRKRSETANPLVPGSNPGGPTTSFRTVPRMDDLRPFEMEGIGPIAYRAWIDSTSSGSFAPEQPRYRGHSKIGAAAVPAGKNQPVSLQASKDNGRSLHLSTLVRDNIELAALP